MAAQRPENINEIILDTAEELLKVNSFSEVTLAKIAEKANISKGTLYYYYKSKNEILFATDGDKETLVCLDGDLTEETVEHFKKHTEQKLIVLERALDTTKKWNLKHYMKDNFKAF